MAGVQGTINVSAFDKPSLQAPNPPTQLGRSAVFAHPSTLNTSVRPDSYGSAPEALDVRHNSLNGRTRVLSWAVLLELQEKVVSENWEIGDGKAAELTFHPIRTV